MDFLWIYGVGGILLYGYGSLGLSGDELEGLEMWMLYVV